jgi:hypothetical protein
VALDDLGFQAAYPHLERETPQPDLFVRLNIPIEESIARQEARGRRLCDRR